MRRTLVLVMTVGLAVLGLAAPASASSNFVASLSGADEVPARDTLARGVATFNLRDGALQYRLIVANIDNPVAAHIHCGPPGVSASVGVTLFGGPAGSGTQNGVLAQGTITAPDAGNACGWTDLAQVIAAIESGNTYVNVHTNDGVAPTNTGPGDWPGGEIRGQVH